MRAAALGGGEVDGADSLMGVGTKDHD